MNKEHNKPFEQTQPVNSPAAASKNVTSGREPACDAVSETVGEVGENLNKAALEVSKVAVDKVAEVIEGVGAAAQSGQEALNKAAGAAGQLGQQATKAGQSAAKKAGEAATVAGKESKDLFARATTEAGKALSFIGDNPILKRIAKLFRAEWLLQFLGQVDIEKAQSQVRKLQQEYPDESPNEIAHRIMVEKSLYAGGIGLVSSVVPGVALALMGVDLAATTALQGEMVYQIAAAYGMDLKDPARRGEVVAIFGLSLGGSTALKTGFGVLRNVPIAGMAIGASTNAAMLYALGYTACRFYEAKTNPLTSEAAADAIQQQSEAYLENAIAQKEIMDRILVHMVLASRPETSWAEIMPELEKMNFTAESLKLIESQMENPLPLNDLLEQLDRDFAFPLLAQCYRISQLDCVTTDEEKRVMEAIANKFDIDLKGIEETVKAQEQE